LAALLGTAIDENGNPIAAPAQVINPNDAEKQAPLEPSPESPRSIKSPDISAAQRQDIVRRLNEDAHQEASRRNDTANAIAGAIVGAGRAVIELPVDQIDNNPFQPRRQFNQEEIESLAESLKEHEQLQPVLVRRMGDRYQLISGERRLRAARHAGFTKIRAEIRQADDRLVAELAIIENLQRKDLNPIEKALSFKRYLKEHLCTQEDLAKRLKIDRSTIANMMRLLELPDAILDAVQRDELSAGHARTLLPLSDERQQIEYARRIMTEGWTVRETERLVAEAIAKEEAQEAGLDGVATRRRQSRLKSQQVTGMEQELKSLLGTKVEIRSTAANRGKIVIHFSSAEEFERLRATLGRPSQFRAAS
jgi:ParB family chromosome partitioning protein